MSQKSTRYAVRSAAATDAPTRQLQLLDLPVELCELLWGRLDSRSLSKLACVCHALNTQTSRATQWKELFEVRWGFATKNQCQAAEIAGGWKSMYICKHPLPECSPCQWEIRAALEAITACASPKGLACCALIDGSGSMCTGDFETMTGVAAELSTALKGCLNSKVSVIQFSGRTQVEVPLQDPDQVDCAAVMKGVTRMNGGTNVAVAVSRAAAEMATLDADIQRVIVLMSDFRIDEYSASEAVAAARTVAKDNPKTSYFAFGVGRLVDFSLVKDLLSAGDPLQILTDAYLWLGSKEDPSLEDY